MPFRESSRCARLAFRARPRDIHFGGWAMGLLFALFTVLTQAAVGMTLALWLTDIIPGRKNPRPARKTPWRRILVMAATGLAALLIHAGGPLEARQSLGQPGPQWIGLECLLFSSFLILVVIANIRAHALVTATALICGLAGIIATGMTYTAPERSLICNALPPLFFMLTTAALGAAFALSFSGQEGQRQIQRILTGVLVLTIAVSIVTPTIWGTGGGAMMRAAALAWSFSPLFWIFIALGLLVPLFLVIGLQNLPAWAAWLMLLGTFAGRAQFFLTPPNIAAFTRFPL